MAHIPVLQKEVIEYLEPKANENFIDCTFGEGGHSLSILKENGPQGKVLGIEIDRDVYEKNGQRSEWAEFQNRLILANDSYVNVRKIIEEKNFKPVNGILADLGMSSWHIEESKKGFSFQKDERLDMRYDALRNELTAEKIINSWSQESIEKILLEYGEEKFSRKITEEIIKARSRRPITTTYQLVEVIKRAIPKRHSYGKIHFATRVFQALRIAVNKELDNLERFLPEAVDILSPGGRIAIISFHSLEDRIVKLFFKSLSSNKIKILTKKPITPNKEEIKNNPRSRSAKMRVAVKI